MDLELVKAVLDAGLGAVGIGVISFLFVKMMKAHSSERQEWRDRNDKQVEKLLKATENSTDAIRELARSINNK